MLEARRKVEGPVGSEYGKDWAKLKAERDYDKALSLTICGDYPGREELTRCGFLSFSCRDRLLCPRCCYHIHGRPLVEEFGGVMPADMQVYYLCLSLSTNADESSRLKYRDFTRADHAEVKRNKLVTPCDADNYGVPFRTQEDVEQCRLIWKLFAEVLKQFTRTGRHLGFLGAVGGPELSVQFAPLRVIPHCNFVVWTWSFTEEDARVLRRLLRKKMRDCRPLKGGIFPSLGCYRLRGRDDLRRVLTYSMKPIDLVGQYTRAAERVNYDAARMESLNAEVSQFLRHLPDAFHRVCRVARYGYCHHGSRKYFGVVTPRRAARRVRQAELRSKRQRTASRTRRKLKKSATLAGRKPRRPGFSRFDYWLFAVMPGPPPMPPSQRSLAPPLAVNHWWRHPRWLHEPPAFVRPQAPVTL